MKVGYRRVSTIDQNLDRQDMSAEDVAHRAIEIASDICVYTNKNIIVEKLKSK